MILALPVLLAALQAAPTPPVVDWSRIPDSVGAASLTPAQKATLAKVLSDEFCHCGCPHTLLGCLTEHRECKHAPRMAALAGRLAAQGLAPNEVLRILTEYYASFDRSRRAKLEVEGWGPPYGDPKAPVTLVEFADFQCPFCQQLRPRLEAFVKSRPGRVKLVFKPFPIPGHARAQEAAEAVEWAREQGIFWQLHDAMFERPGALDDDSLAALARKFGKDGDALRAALAERRMRPRVQAAQAEAQRAGVAGTPTLFVNGRRHVIPDFSDTVLEFVLEDEEEWLKGGWRD